MRVRGLDGKEYKWNLTDTKENQNASSYHQKVRKILKEEFPTQLILEEVFLPGVGRFLFADFFVPHRKMMVEVNGRQHYEQVGHFHGTDLLGKISFLQGQKRDRQKKEWCRINRISLVELSYEEDEIVWRNKIRKG